MAHTTSSRSRTRDSVSQGTLSQLQGNVVLPSTLNYKERTELRRKDAYEYGRIYNTADNRGMTVWGRLTADAGVRQTLKSSLSAASPQDISSFAAMAHAAATTAAATAAAGKSESRWRSQTVSGFISNNNPNLTSRQQASETACSADPPLSALHPITLRSYYKKFPLDFLAAARPQVRTTNETLRMLGTYSSDEAVAQRLGVHIPHGCSCAGLTRQ